MSGTAMGLFRVIGGSTGKHHAASFASRAVIPLVVAGGGALLAIPILSSLLRAASPTTANGDGGMNAAGWGMGGLHGYNPDGAGMMAGYTWANPGWALLHPVQATKNSVKSGINKASGGWLFATPSAADRYNRTGVVSNDIGASIANGAFDKNFSSPNIGDVIGGNLSPEEEAMIAQMDPKDRARYLLQKRMQEKAEMSALCSQLQAMRHQTAMQTINNIR